MRKEKNTLKVAALTSGAVIMSAFGANEANAAALLDFESFGTGAELRTNLITANAVNPIISNTNIELECGEGKCGEGKCGEGKSGEGSEKKTEGKTEVNTIKPAKAASTTNKSTTVSPSTSGAKATGEKKSTEIKMEKPKSANPN